MEQKESINWEKITNQRDQPTGVILLALLHIAGAALGLLLVIPQLLKPEPILSPFDNSDIQAWQIILKLGVITGAVFLSGIGMLLGKRWGWYLAVFYYVNSILRNAYTVFMIEQIRLDLELDATEVRVAYMKYGGRLIVQFLLLFYLLRDNVVYYFGLRIQGKFVSLAIVFALCILELTIFALL